MKVLFIILIIFFIACFTGIIVNNYLRYYSITPSNKFAVYESKLFKVGKHDSNDTINSEVLNKLSTILICAKKYNIQSNGIVGLIDYSQPADKKRLWMIDINKNEILFNTYVSHGIKSGTLASEYFSNRFNGKASSLGVYTTQNVYHGRHGISLKLLGLDKNFNNHAYQRAIVMHGAWYMDENFIKKYGRPGRSWGCPAVPLNWVDTIIQTLKNGSLLVAYYPNQNWFLKSKFLNCNNTKQRKNIINAIEKSNPVDKDVRKDILFVDANNNDKREEYEPILTVSADNYHQMYKTQVPLNRMLRRRVDNVEFIALTPAELKIFNATNQIGNFNSIKFIIPHVIRHGSSYITQLKIVNMGKIKKIEFHQLANINPTQTATIYFDDRSPMNVKSTDQFIRWLGL